MKKLRVVLIGGLMINVLALGQAQQTQTGNTVDVPPPTPYAVVSQGANSKVWEWTTYEALPSGQVVSHLHHYTELATGLSYQQNGQWVDSQEQINIQPDGTASATAGQHQAYFPSDIGNGTLTLVTPDGLQLQSQPLGLFYDDGSNTVMLAELTNSVGQLISPNQIIYTNAFTGLDADLLYTYTKAGFEQDVILNEQPQSPEAYGLNPQTAQLQMLTEFFNPPQPAVTTVQLPEQAGVALSDDTLGFGAMKMVPGRAFLLGTNADDGQVMVGKQWLLVGDRQFLAESVPVAAVANQLAQMPAVQISSISSKSPLNVVSATRLLPPHRLAQKTNTHPKRIAEAKIPRKGFLLDYQTDNSSQTNVIFRGDTTYYISSTVDLFGTNTFEGGTVIKYATNGCIYQAGGNIEWNANAYNPVIFTAKDDNTVGQAITGSTGNPTNYYANPEALGLFELVSTCSISNFRVSRAVEAINIVASDWVNLYHGQIANCQNGVAGEFVSLNLGNMLFANITNTDLSLNYESIEAQNVTFGSSAYLTTGTGSVDFKNCILANVNSLTNSSSLMTMTGDVNGFYNSPPFGVAAVTNTFYPFQTVGAGGYYLTNGCQFRSNGITAIDSELLAELAEKTTYPPVVFSNTAILYATNFMPQAQRDNNGTTVDLGYHYDSIDYAFGGVSASTNLSFSAGTVMGWFELPGSDGDGYGIALPIGSTVTFNGTATSPCFEARYDTVQEGGNGLWKDLGSLGGIVANGHNGSSASFASGVNAQFTHFAGFANGENYVRDDTSDAIFNAKDCEFWSGDEGGYGIHIEFTNCLINGLTIGVQANSSVYSSLVMENCTMREGYILTAHWDGAIWPVWIRNSAYEGTDMSQMDNTTSPTGTNIYCNYNSFLTSTNQLTDEGTNTVVVTNGYNWQTSSFGNYYLPTNSSLLKKGNTNANILGLYEFTTQTNQTPEGTNVIDIGYHYVATDTNGNPLDTYVSGTPNYIVDSQGNGMDTNGLPYWWEGEYFGEVGLDPSSDPDDDGNDLLYDYENDIDPNVIQFMVLVTNNYVNTSVVSANAIVIGGVPFYDAVLINDTNYTHAVWQPFTSTNLTINLGSSNGLYTVLVGLKGLPSNAQQTWQQVQMTLNNTSLALTITNPPNGTVSTPLIQLQGYANGELTGLSFGVSNALNNVTNQVGYVTDEFYDTNLVQFTTNYFQCYDVVLTNGLNAITICATNVLGQVIITNFNITLSYSGDTTPPVLTVAWPQDGTYVSGNSFSFHGTVDDETATVMAQIVDTNNDTNFVQGLVERDGTVTIGNLPMSAGENILSVTATNAAGNSTTTNLTLFQSAVIVTMDPLTQFNQASVSVTGTISDPTYSLTVNGINAYYLDDDGDWEADDVPANPAGTVTFDIEIYTGDPVNAGSHIFTEVQPPFVTLADEEQDCFNTSFSGFDLFKVNWTFARGGGWSVNYVNTNPDAGHGSSTLLPDGTNYTLPTVNYAFYDAPAGWQTWTGQLSSAWQSAQGSIQYYSVLYQPSVQTTLMVVPSGPKLTTVSKTYDMRACAMSYSRPSLDTSYWYLNLRQLSLGDTPMTPGQLQLDGQALVSVGVTNCDGSVWGTNSVSAMAGTLIPLRLTSSGYYDFTFNMQIVKDKLYWQNMVQSEIDSDSSVVIENYLAGNGFLNNRQNIQAVYAFYQKIFSQEPGNFLWAGLAKLAGAPVYAGLSDAQYASLSTFQQTLIQMNIDIMNDLAWQFEAYKNGGLCAIQTAYAVGGSELDASATNAWGEIDQGIQQDNVSLIESGNLLLLQREQEQILANGYNTLNDMTGISTVMSILAQSPVPPPPEVDYPPTAWDFQSVVPGGNICNYNDRWSWITDPTMGIWVTWLNDPNQLSDVAIPLKTRAATFASFPVY